MAQKIKLSAKNQRRLKILGYGFFGLFSVLLHSYFLLPADLIAQKVTSTLAQQSQGQWHITYKRAALYGLGLELQSPLIQHANPYGDSQRLRLQKAHLHLHLLPLLWGTTTAAVNLELKKGRVQATLTPKGSQVLDASWRITDLDLAELSQNFQTQQHEGDTNGPPAFSIAALAPQGILSSQGKVRLTPQPQKTALKLALTLKNARIGPGQVMGMSIPQIDLGHISLPMTAQDGNYSLGPLKQEKGFFKIRSQGQGALAQPLDNSSLDLCLQLKPDAAWLAKNPGFKAAFSMLEMQAIKDAQGFLNIPIKGSLGMPQIRQGACRADPGGTV